MMHKNSHKIQFSLQWRYFGRQYDVIIVFSLSVGLKFGNFYFGPMRLKFRRGGIYEWQVRISTQNNR